MYLLLLDESGSMGGSWSSLISAASAFTTVVNSPALKQFSKLSIVTYESSAEIKGENLEPSSAL